MNKLFAILIMCSLLLPVLATEEQGAELATMNEETQEVIVPEQTELQNEFKTEIEQKQNTEPELLLPPKNTPRTKYKEPVGKKNLIKKFIIAMVCVAGTSIFLYGALSLYNKFRNALTPNQTVPPEGEQPLEAPNDLTDAIKTFVEKTRWDK